MNNVGIFETAHDMHYCVHFADMRQKFVAQSFAGSRALDKTGYIHEFEYCGSNFLRVVHFTQNVQTLVRNGDNAHIGFYCAERIVCAFRARIGYCVEQCTFAYVR